MEINGQTSRQNQFAMNLPTLNKQWCKANTKIPIDHLTGLPEKVIQFGTGVLLRGLPDYYIDKANKAGIFNGRIVVVKSTTHGDTGSLADQDYLFTHLIRGIEQGKSIASDIINTSVSRVLQAQTQWNEILDCAANTDINIILSNTTEQGLVYVDEDITVGIPTSFPGKMLAFLYHRFQSLGYSATSDIIVIPTELIENNGALLKEFILKGAEFNGLGDEFMVWLHHHVTFCNSLVDRIVPGKPADDLLKEIEAKLGYHDNHVIISEPFNLWAIEGDKRVKEILSFAQADDGIKIVDDISVYKELKLRLLNATHILSCGIALMEGHTTVAKSLEFPAFSDVVNTLIEEIKTSIPKDIPIIDISSFAGNVIDRFKNPYIHHQWSSIILNYSDKMKIRVIPLMAEYYRKFGRLPKAMMKGLAAYFYISIPDRLDNDIYYKDVNGKWLRLQDPFSEQIYQNMQLQGKEGVIQQVLEEFLLKESTLLPLAGEIQQQIITFQYEFAKHSMVQNG